MGKTLIIKLGAAGDVLRTTPILRALDTDVIWLTGPKALPLLPEDRVRPEVFGKGHERLLDEHYDCVLSLDEDPAAAAFAAKLKTYRRIGVFADGRKGLRYTPESSPWFDMSLISRYGRERADRLKRQNRLTYQEMLFSMAGLVFKGEEYILPSCARGDAGIEDHGVLNSRVRIGLDARAGERWPSKRWSGYEKLAEQLNAQGLEVIYFRERPRLEQFIRDIASCPLVVTGDTLTMHLALGLKKYVTALFTCTSPFEVFGYGRMIKKVSPRLEEYFYATEYHPGAVSAITVEEVFRSVLFGADTFLQSAQAMVPEGVS